MAKSKIPVCALLWRDASYVYTKRLQKLPSLQLTIGFIIEANDEFTNIAMNVNYNPKTKKFWPLDGFIVPEKAIVEFKVIKFINV